MRSFAGHVLAIRTTSEGRQRASVLEHCRKQALRWRPCGAAPGVVSGRDQRQPARGMVSPDRSIRRRERATSTACVVSGRTDGAGSSRGLWACRCGSMRWSCIGRANGARAGSPVISMSSLELDRFFAPLLPDSREGTSWQHILQTLVCYRLIDPGSEWRLHRQWFEAERDGGFAGRRLCAGREECAVSLSR